MARAHRMGQTKTVTVVRYITKNSVEQVRISFLQKRTIGIIADSGGKTNSKSSKSKTAREDSPSYHSTTTLPLVTLIAGLR